MTRPERDEPDGGWDLPAPDTAVLLMGPTVEDRLAVALALKELIARRVLRFRVAADTRLPGWLRLPKILILGLGDDRPANASRSLRCVIDLYSARSCAGTRQVSVEEVAARLVMTWGAYVGRIGAAWGFDTVTPVR